MFRLPAIAEKLAARAVDRVAATEDAHAAVAAILRSSPQTDEVELLFILRAEHPNDPWSGHVAFPGGRREPEDDDLLATAIRETREEVGIRLSPEQVRLRLPDIPAFTRSKKGQLVVTSFVFVLTDDVAIVPNREVAKTLWVPLATFASAGPRASFELDHDGHHYELPCVYLEPGGHRLWGLTLRMVDALVEALV